MPTARSYISSLKQLLTTDCAAHAADERTIELAWLLLFDLLKKQDLNDLTPKQLEQSLEEVAIPTATGSNHPETAARLQLHRFVHAHDLSQREILLQGYLLALQARGCSKATIKNYLSDIRQLFALSPEKRVEETLTETQLSMFIKKQESSGLAQRSIRRKLTTTAQFAKWLLAEGVIEASRADSLYQLSQTYARPETGVDQTVPLLMPIVAVAAVASQAVPATDKKPIVVDKIATSYPSNNHMQEKVSSNTVEPNQSKKTYNIKRFLPKMSMQGAVTALALVLSVLGLSLLAWMQFLQNVDQPLAYPTALTRPTRSLSFQGRLTNPGQNPITSATDMNFKLYNSGPATTSGTILWDSGSCSVDPDQDGIFSTGLGDDCGSEIDEAVFSENSSVWLQISVGTSPVEVLAPRQPIKSVAYALNSETVQGYPASASAVENTVIVMNNSGEIVLGNSAPTIKATSTNGLTIEGQSLYLTTTSGSNGNVNLSPDGTGKIMLNANASSSGTLTFTGTTDPKINVLNGENFGIRTSVGGDAGLAERLTVLNGGNVGIGTTAPNNTLQVANLIDFNNTNYNTKLGFEAGKNIVSGATDNTFVGYQAGLSSFGSSTNAADYNSAFGSQALFSNTTGYLNTANGASSLFSNTTGIYNTANGVNALSLNTTGNYNTANGVNALYANTTGYFNTATGDNAGRFIADGLTANRTSNNSLYLGSDTRALADGDTNEIVIGASAIGVGSNSVVLGNDSITKTILKGNVGIGDTTPTYKLDVNGTGRFTGAVDLDGDVELNSTLTDVNNSVGTNGQVLSSTTTGVDWVDAASLGTNFWQMNAGTLSPFSNSLDLLVGGTSTQSAKFAFINNNGGAPTASISGNLALSVPTGANPAVKQNVYNGGSLGFQTSVGGDASLTERMTILNNGNMGIGTTSPLARLDVRYNETVADHEMLNLVGTNWLGGKTYLRIGPSQNPSGNAFMAAETGNDVGAGAPISLLFGTTTGPSAPTEKWRITDDGKWRSNGSGSITTSTGNMSISSGGGNGHILLYPNGTGRVGIGTSSPTGNLEIKQTAASTGVLKGLVYTGAINFNQTLSTEIPSLTLTTAGRQWATGALTTQREVLVTQPVYSFVGASTITDAATVGIAGAPNSSTNATLTNSHALLIQSADVTGTGAATNSYGLTVNAQSGATYNYAAQFMGGNVGIGSTSPGAMLDVTGSIRSSGQLISTVATGTPPLVVSSTDLVSNLNADYLDNYHVTTLPFVNNTADTTLTRAGVGPYTLVLNLGNANTWTAAQTFTANTNFDGTGADGIWTSTGNVGIGTITPGSYLLNVNGTTNIAGLLTATAITNTGALTSTGGIVSLNASSNNAVNIGTGTTTSAVTIGGNANDVIIDSDTWNVSSLGAATGLTGISSSGTINFSGLTASKVVFTDASSNLTSTGIVPVDQGGTGASTLTGMLKGNGTSAVTAVTGTAGYNSYWSDANTIGTEQFTNVTRGGMGANMTAAGAGEIPYSTSTTAYGHLAAGTSGMALISGGAAAPSWGTLGLTYGGTNANLSAVATGGLIYKGATALAGTAALTGVVKGNGASAPSAMTSTTSYVTYWSDANTLAGEAQLALTRGGSNKSLTAVAGGVVWTDADSMELTAAGTAGQVLKSNGTTSPTWVDSSTLPAGDATTLDTIDSTQFLRSDTSDSFTSGTLTTDATTTLDVNGGLSVADTDIVLDGASTNLSATGNLSINTDDFFVQKTDGNVGIGTTAPAAFKLQVAGHVGPQTDDTYDLGSSALRWRDLYLGPTSLHLSSTIAETATARDWKIGLDETNGATDGNFRIMEGASQYVTIKTDGNVGVGSTSPAQKLDVVGNVAFTGALMPNGNAGTLDYFLRSAGAGAPPVWADLSTLTLPSGTTGQTLRHNGTSWTASSVIYNDSTNVGIGTTVPGLFRLNVSGDTNISSALTVGTGLTVTSGTVSLPNDQIGDAELANAVTVSGGTLGSNTITAGSAWTNSGTLDIGTSTWDISAAGVASNFTGMASSGNIDLSALAAGGMVKAAVTTGRLSIASAGTDYQVPLTFENGLTKTVNTVRLGGPLVANTEIAQAGFNVNFSGTGNLGIGTTSAPAAKLQVIYSDTGASNRDGMYSDLTVTGGGAFTGVGTKSLATFSGTSGTLSNLYGFLGSINATANGTGAVTNGSPLQLEATVATGATITNLTMANIASPTNSGTISTLKGINIAAMTAGANNWALYQAGASDRSYFAGNVGIGSTDPQAKLEITGDMLISGGINAPLSPADDNISFHTNKTNDTTVEWLGFYSGAQRQGMLAYDGTIAGCMAGTSVLCLYADNANYLNLHSDTGVILTGGNVGIGTTTTAAAKLTIAGDTLIETGNSLYVGGPTGTTDGVRLHYVGNGTTTGSAYIDINHGTGAATGLFFRTGLGDGYTTGTALFIEGATGDVGIHNSAPAYPLDVTGSIRSTSQLISTIATGTAPLAITSTTAVGNLNADLLDDWHRDTIRNNMLKTTEVMGSGVAGGFDADTLLSAGGMMSNYGSNAWWGNAPSGMTYGSIMALMNSNDGENLSGQLAWDINHNTATPTRGLWFRASNNLGFGNDWTKVWTDVNTSSGIYISGGTYGLVPPTGNYGTVQTSGGKGTWPGYSIAGDLNFMGTGSGTGGIYDDGVNRWNTLYTRDTSYVIYEPDSANAAVTVDANGNVGFGTTSPSWNLHVSRNVNDGNPAVLVQNPNTGTSSQARISLSRGSDGTTISDGFGMWSAISSAGLADYENRDISFWTGTAGAPSSRVVFYNSGNILFGGGVTSGTTTLDIGGGTTGYAVCHSGAAATTDNVALVDCGSAPSADYMEMYSVDAGLEMGDIVAPSLQTVSTTTGDSLAKLRTTNTPYEPTVIGVISNSDDIGDFNTIGYNIKPEDNPMPVALKGRVRVKVNSSNGSIKVGDYITASGSRGVGMKSTKAGMVVGQSLEEYHNSNTGETGMVMIFVATAWHDPNTMLATNGELTVTGENGQYAVSSPIDGTLVESAYAAASMIAGSIQAGIVRTKDLVVTNSANVANLTVSSLQVGGQSLTAYIENVVSNMQLANSTALPSGAFVSELNTEDLTASGSATLGDTFADTLTVNKNASISGNLAVASDASIAGKLQANGSIFDSLLSDTAVLGTATISGVTADDEPILDVRGSARMQALEAQVANLQDVRALTATLYDATISGTLYANTIAGLDAKVAAGLQPTLLQQLIGYDPAATNSAQLIASITGVDLGTTLVLDPSALDSLPTNPTLLGANAGFFEHYLQVNGSTALGGNLMLAGNLNMTSGMTIADNSISYVPLLPDSSTTLYIQPSGTGALDLMNGLALLANGAVTVTGDVTFTKNITVAQTLFTDLLAPTSYDAPVQVKVAGIATESGDIKQTRFEIINELDAPVATISAQGKADFAGGISVGRDGIVSQDASGSATVNKSSGKAVISAGSTQIRLLSAQIKPDTLIYVTAQGDTQNQSLYIKNQIVGEAVIGFNTPLPADLRFNWWIVE